MKELTLENLKAAVEEFLAGSDCFLVEAVMRPDDIIVNIDSDSRVDIDYVADLSRYLSETFAPAIDDYNLEVGTVGLTTPFVLPRQYRKNLGQAVEVLAADGKKYTGILSEVTDEGFALTSTEKVKKEGAKRPVMEAVTRNFAYGDVKKTISKF